MNTEQALIQQLRHNLSNIQKQNYLHNRKILLNQTFKIYDKLQNHCNQLNPSNKKNHLKKQIQRTKRTLQGYQESIKKEQQLRVIGKHQQQYSLSKTMSFKQANSKQDLILSMIYKQITIHDLILKESEIQTLYKNVNNNQNLQKQINLWLKEQGDQLERVSQQIEIGYEEILQANSELKSAEKIVIQNRILKIRLVISAALALLGSIIAFITGISLTKLFE